MKLCVLFLAALNVQWPVPTQGFAMPRNALRSTHSHLARPDDVYDIEPIRDTNDKPKKGFLASLNPFNLFKPKEKLKSDMERLIDDQLKGTGPLGALLGTGLKGLGRTLEKGMQAAMKDVSEVLDEVKRVLRADRYRLRLWACLNGAAKEL